MLTVFLQCNNVLPPVERIELGSSGADARHIILAAYELIM